MKITWTLLCLCGVLASVPGFAAEKKKPLLDVSGGQGYGMAGCGLGSIIFGEQTGPIQIIAATTNIYGVQTFAISTGTSNCDNAGTKDSRSASLFITANREALEKDVARGSGETVTTLSELMGCQNDKAFGSKLQSNYGKIFQNPKTSTESVVQSIVNTVKTDAVLSKSCG